MDIYKRIVKIDILCIKLYMDKKLINNKRKEIISRINIYVFGNCYIYI